jgi:DNA-binding MarR family transcriptional regulator
MSAKDNFQNTLENWVSVYLYRSLTEFFNYLRSTGISMQQAYALTYIYYNGPSKISELCEHMMVSAPATSQMVDRLEKQNLVERIAQPGDRRVRNVVLSGEGKKFVQESIEARQSWVKEIPPSLTDAQIDQISDALELLITIYREKPE